MILQVCETRLYWRGPIMCMPPPTFESQPSLSPSQIADLRLAASKMTGPKRRAFEAEMTLKYCRGNPLKASPSKVYIGLGLLGQDFRSGDVTTVFVSRSWRWFLLGTARMFLVPSQVDICRQLLLDVCEL